MKGYLPNSRQEEIEKNWYDGYCSIAGYLNGAWAREKTTCETLVSHFNHGLESWNGMTYDEFNSGPTLYLRDLRIDGADKLVSFEIGNEKEALRVYNCASKAFPQSREFLYDVNETCDVWEFIGDGEIYSHKAKAHQYNKVLDVGEQDQLLGHDGADVFHCSISNYSTKKIGLMFGPYPSAGMGYWQKPPWEKQPKNIPFGQTSLTRVAKLSFPFWHFFESSMLSQSEGMNRDLVDIASIWIWKAPLPPFNDGLNFEASWVQPMFLGGICCNNRGRFTSFIGGVPHVTD